MSAVRHQQFALNDIFSETARPPALIFGVLHVYCLVNRFQIYSNGGPGVQNGPAAGVLASNRKYCGGATSASYNCSTVETSGKVVQSQ